MARTVRQFRDHLSNLAENALPGRCGQGAELAPARAGGGTRGHQVDHAGERGHQRDTRVVPTDQPPQTAADAGTDEGRERPGGGRQRVRRDEPLLGDDNRQTRGQRGKHEPVDTDHRQRGRVEVSAGMPSGDQHDEQAEQDCPDQRADHQHPLP